MQENPLLEPLAHLLDVIQRCDDPRTKRLEIALIEYLGGNRPPSSKEKLDLERVRKALATMARAALKAIYLLEEGDPVAEERVAPYLAEFLCGGPIPIGSVVLETSSASSSNSNTDLEERLRLLHECEDVVTRLTANLAERTLEIEARVNSALARLETALASNETARKIQMIPPGSRIGNMQFAPPPPDRHIAISQLPPAGTPLLRAGPCAPEEKPSGWRQRVLAFFGRGELPRTT